MLDSPVRKARVRGRTAGFPKSGLLITGSAVVGGAFGGRWRVRWALALRAVADRVGVASDFWLVQTDEGPGERIALGVADRAARIHATWWDPLRLRLQSDVVIPPTGRLRRRATPGPVYSILM